MNFRILAMAVALLAAAAVGGCVHTHARTASITRDVFRVNVATDGLAGTSGDVVDHGLYAGAQGTIERGGRYFVLLDSNGSVSRSVSTMPGFGGWNGSSYYYVPSQSITTEIIQGDFLFRIVPPRTAGAFDAQEILEVMGPRFDPKRRAAAANRPPV